jgi:phage terminase small subunit
VPAGAFAVAGLTEKRRRFAREYAKDANGSAAYIRAGYKAKNARVARTCAAQLLAIPSIMAAVEAHRNQLAAKTETEAEWVRRRLKEEADFRGEGTSHSARVTALRTLAEINGLLDARTLVPTGPAVVVVLGSPHLAALRGTITPDEHLDGTPPALPPGNLATEAARPDPAEVAGAAG